MPIISNSGPFDIPLPGGIVVPGRSFVPVDQAQIDDPTIWRTLWPQTVAGELSISDAAPDDEEPEPEPEPTPETTEPDAEEDPPAETP